MYTKIFKKLILLVYIFLLLSYRFSCTHGASLFFFKYNGANIEIINDDDEGSEDDFFLFPFLYMLVFFCKT